MTWAVVPAVAAVGDDVVDTAAAEFGAASSCHWNKHSPFSITSNAVSTCAPSHASHSLKTAANCVRHYSLLSRCRRSRRRRVVFRSAALQRRRKTQISRVALETRVSTRSHISDSHLQGAAVVRYLPMLYLK